MVPFCWMTEIYIRESVGRPFGPSVVVFEFSVDCTLDATDETDWGYAEPVEKPTEMTPLQDVAEFVPKQLRVVF